MFSIHRLSPERTRPARGLSCILCLALGAGASPSTLQGVRPAGPGAAARAADSELVEPEPVQATRAPVLKTDPGMPEFPPSWAWLTVGNSGTNPLTHYVGTDDNQPLNLRVNKLRAMRYEYAANTQYRSVNVLGGTDLNSIAPGVVGATIAGGGQDFFAGTDYPNAVTNHFGTIGGGGGHAVSGFAATVAGGALNTASSQDAAVVGGRVNTASGQASFVGAGGDNVASGAFSSIAGGQLNSAGGFLSAVAGGGSHTASGVGAAITGGYQNRATGDYSFAGGGLFNDAQGTYDTVCGGDSNVASGQSSTIGGGSQNAASNQFATVAGGTQNAANGDTAAIGGGAQNAASASWASVGGGLQNNAGGDRATVGGGYINTAGADYDTVAGGRENGAVGGDSFVGGGHANQAGAPFAVIGGGDSNLASGFGATIAGGTIGVVNARGSTIGGGNNNFIGGELSVIPGGESNVAQGQLSFAAGQQAQALHHGAFVWADNSNTPFASSAMNQFCVRASGGTCFYSNASATAGVSLAPGAGVWSTISDRAAKERIEAVDGRDVLARLSEVPISTWNYKSQDATIRHMGPMSQDFYAAFALGPGERTIDTVDPDGVALAAIQGLHAIVLEQGQRIADLEARLGALERALR